MVRPLVAAAAAVSLAVTPLVAQATPVERVPAETAGEQERIVGLLWQYLILPVIVGAVIALLSGGDDEEPASP